MTYTKKGFTLLELLIVIAILAILATVVVLVLNPAEYLKQARDTQRMNDLDAVKSALNLYIANSTSSAPLSVSGACYGAGNGRVTAAPTVNPFTAPTTAAAASINQTVAGSGWIPVNFSAMVGGSPLGKLPVDPANPNDGGHLYAFSCDSGATQFKLSTALESSKYQGLMTTDGGTSNSYYEVGTNMGL